MDPTAGIHGWNTSGNFDMEHGHFCALLVVRRKRRSYGRIHITYSGASWSYNQSFPPT